MENPQFGAVGRHRSQGFISDESDVSRIKPAGGFEFPQIRAGFGDDHDLIRFETLGKRGVQDVEAGEIGGDGGVGLQRRRNVVRPAVKRGEIDGFEAAAFGEEHLQLVAGGGDVWTLVPPHELGVLDVFPLRGDEVDGVEVPGVESDGGERREGVAKEVGDEVGVGGGAQGVAPGGEEGEVEGGDGGEACGDHEEVAEVAAEGEGGACAALQQVPPAADQGGGVAAPDVRHGGDYVRDNHLGEVADGGPGGGHAAAEIQICISLDFFSLSMVSVCADF